MIEMLHCDCMEYMATLPDNAFDPVELTKETSAPELFEGGN